jgi:hypothetical protein
MTGEATRPPAHDRAARCRVGLALFGPYAALLPAEAGGRTVVEVGAGDTVDDVLDAVAVPPQGRTYLTLDGVRVDGDAPVHDGAELRVIVPLGGG